jgi:hypothetical protein
MTTLLYVLIKHALFYLLIGGLVWSVLTSATVIGTAVYYGFPITPILTLEEPHVLEGMLFLAWFITFMTATGIIALVVVLFAAFIALVPSDYVRNALKPIPKGHEPSLMQQWIRDIHAKTCTMIEYK